MTAIKAFIGTTWSILLLVVALMIMLFTILWQILSMWADKVKQGGK